MCRKISLALLFCAAFASLSAQAPSTSTTDSRWVALDSRSPKPSDIVSRLSALSTQLLSEVDGSQIDLDELRNSLSESKNVLVSLQSSLDSAQVEAKKRNLELWLWRGGTALGVAGTIAALVWGHK